MASVPLSQVSVPQAGPLLLGTIRDNGTVSHPYAASDALLRGPDAARNLADAIHFLCALHGRYPGVIELVGTRTVEPAAREWLSEASESFAGERAYLANLAVRAGPVPATPGAGSEAAVSMQRNAVLTLAQSERRGCAIGAALALAGDWGAVRQVLDVAGARFGADIPRPWMTGERIDAVAETLCEEPPMRRALLFGAEQISIQHRGLWDLLAARAEARRG